MTNYLYYIGIGSVDSKSLKKDDRPKIRKVNKNSAVEIFKIVEKEFEGPFISLTELKSELLDLRMKQATASIEKSHRINAARKDIARILKNFAK